MSGELVALNQNWLDVNSTSDPIVLTTAGAVSIASGGAVGCSNNLYYSGHCWPPYSHTWLYTTTERKPIRLGYSEVERLRTAAKRDAKLKKILQKFTDQIEVVVDFE